MALAQIAEPRAFAFPQPSVPRSQPRTLSVTSGTVYEREIDLTRIIALEADGPASVQAGQAARPYVILFETDGDHATCVSATGAIGA